MIEAFELYNSEIILEFDSAKHQYRVVNRGRRYKVPSVTRITGIIDKSGPLIPWAINSTLDIIKGAIQPDTPYPSILLDEIYETAKKESQRRKSDAARKGTEVHEILAAALGESAVPAEESVSRRVGFAKQWLEENRVEWRYIERPIYSRRYRYSGRLDGVAVVGGVLTLLDWKTGKGIYPEFRLQTAAYNHAYEEEFPDQKIEQRIILHLEEDKVTPHYYPRELLRQDFSAFTGAARLFKRIQEIDKQMRHEKKKTRV